MSTPRLRSMLFLSPRALGYGALALGLTMIGLGLAPRHSVASSPPLLIWPRFVLPPLPAPVQPTFIETLDVSKFQRGNIHTHSRWSDGDSAPQVVYGWYKAHGYQWLAITDHNTRTDPDVFKPIEKKGKFVMVPGEEVTMVASGRQVHVNALCHTHTIGGHTTEKASDALAWAVAQIHAQGGVALVNHPNWDWALTADDLPGARGAELLEIFSGHPWVHQEGDATHKSHEQIWDQALTGGLDFGGAAVDDAHIFGAIKAAKAAGPGRGWVEVFADEPRRDLICEALAKKRFYSSSGPKLARIAVTRDALSVWPAARAAVVEFIGKNGDVLQKGPAGDKGEARYELKPGDLYVRARITDPNGKQAWTMAYRTTPVL